MRRFFRTRLGLRPALGICALAVVALSCTLQPPTGDSVAMSTAVAATLTARSSLPEAPATAEPTTGPLPNATAVSDSTSPPPPEGTSLNCDGTYQRLSVVDEGEAGKALILDNWHGSEWQTVWTFEAEDPMVRQLPAAAGLYAFGGCRQLIVAPLRYAGSGAVLELQIFAWDGEEIVKVYQNDGIGGEWSREGATIRFTESLYLYDEPNCCPCNRRTTVHRWNGSAFLEEDTEITPTYTGTPPPICQP